jgi:hypothetical protein
MPTMAILIFLISRLLKLKNYLNYIVRSKTQVRPLQSRQLRPPTWSGSVYCKRRMSPKSRPLARTDIRAKVTGIPGARKALARR